MKISARNQISGTIRDIRKGATTADIQVEITGGQIVTAAITNEVVDELGLKVAARRWRSSRRPTS